MLKLSMRLETWRAIPKRPVSNNLSNLLPRIDIMPFDWASVVEALSALQRMEARKYLDDT